MSPEEAAMWRANSDPDGAPAERPACECPDAISERVLMVGYAGTWHYCESCGTPWEVS